MCKMKKLLIISFLLILLLLSGCSQQVMNKNKYKGEHGTYELIETRILEKSSILKEEYARVYFILKYTNSTKEARKPGESVRLDMVLEQETEVELNDVELMPIAFSEVTDAGSAATGTGITGELSWVEENQEWKKGAGLNVKPGATVEFLAQATVKKEAADTIYLRNKNAQGNEKKFEKKVVVDKIIKPQE